MKGNIRWYSSDGDKKLTGWCLVESEDGKINKKSR